MSEVLNIDTGNRPNAQADPLMNAPATSRSLFRTLIWKEFRELGMFAWALIILGLLVLVLSDLLTGGSNWQLEVIKASIANTIPFLVTLSLASASFAIEKENGSYGLLRALPIGSGWVVLAKSATVILFTALSCLLIWPLSYFLLIDTPSEKASFLSGMARSPVSLLEAFLWGTLFSLRGGSVVASLVKATVGWLLISNVAVVLSKFGLGRMLPMIEAADPWIHPLVAIGVALLTVREVSRWSRDRIAGSRRIRFPIRLDRFSSANRWGAVGRLVWLQLSLHGMVLAGMVLIMLVVVFVLADPLYHGQLHIPIAASMLSSLAGGIAVNGFGRRGEFLVGTGLTPLRIWLVHQVLPAGLLLSEGILSVIYLEVSQAVFPVRELILCMLFSFAIGQLAGMGGRHELISMTLATVLGTVGGWVATGMVASVAYSLIPVSGACFLFPLLVVNHFYGNRLLNRPLGMRFWVAVPVAILLLLAPLTWLRVLDIPYMDPEQVLARIPKVATEDSRERQELRRIGDGLIENLQQAVERANRDRNRYDDPLFSERETELAREALKANYRLELLLDRNGWEPRDPARASAILHACRHQLVRLFEPEFGLTREEVDQIILDFDHLLLMPPTDIVHRWALDPRTTADKITSLIGKLGDEKRMTRWYRLQAGSEYLRKSAFLDLEPFTLQQYATSEHDQTWVPIFRRLFFWEAFRCRRDLVQELNARLNRIERLEAVSNGGVVGESDLFALNRSANEQYSLFDLWIYDFPLMDDRGHLHRLLEWRVMQIRLALLLWQKQHDGKLPEKLAEITPGILERLPVSPYDGQPIHFAPQGLTKEQIRSSLHFQVFAVSASTILDAGTDSNVTAEMFAERPFLWMNRYQSPAARGFRHKDWIRIDTLEEFLTKQGDADLIIWFLPAVDSQD